LVLFILFVPYSPFGLWWKWRAESERQSAEAARHSADKQRATFEGFVQTKDSEKHSYRLVVVKESDELVPVFQLIVALPEEEPLAQLSFPLPEADTLPLLTPAVP